MTEHWSTDEKQRSRFWAAIASMGLSNDEAKDLLGVQDLRRFPGTMGDALNTIQAALGKRAKDAPASATVSGDLYPDEKTQQFAEAIARVAPWAHNDKYPLDAADIAMAVLRSIAMGLDCLNQHEVQIWKDARGMHFQLAHALMCQWAQEILGGHTEPKYTKLGQAELAAEGLAENDVAYWCEFVMKEDIPMIGTMIKSGWEPLDARAAMTARGLGTATQAEWSGRYFGPAARSKNWKVRSRAYTDTLRMRFGTPGRPIIEEMRRSRGEDHIIPTDWQLAAGTAEERVRLAALTATDREREPDNRKPEQVLAEGRAILHGEGVEV